MSHQNDLTNIPAAACGVCGGWTSQGGMSQYAKSLEPVQGRTGCTGPHMDLNPWRALKRQQLEESLEAWLEQLGDTVSQHRAECAGFGDSWPGACEQIRQLEDQVAAVEREIATLIRDHN